MQKKRNLSIKRIHSVALAIVGVILLSSAFFDSKQSSPGLKPDKGDSSFLDNYKKAINIPPLPESPSGEYFGSRISRTLSLLATSTQTHPNHIRVLFYGQSIVQGLDTKSMMDELKSIYPYADIEYENLAIGGFQAPNLIRTAVHDLYPYYPDLLIFHVYGGENTGDLERIIYNTRKYTTADILLFTHHYGWESNPEKLAENIKRDDESSVYWRYLAQKYGCELADVRIEWKNYLETYPFIGINSLMGDTIHSNVHPNQKGNKLLELLLLRHLLPHPDLFYRPCAGWTEKVREFEMKRFFFEDRDEMTFSGKARVETEGMILGPGEMRILFSGNKVLLYTFPYEKDGIIRVLIDGKTPSLFPELYYSTRPSKAFQHWRPALKRVNIGEDPVSENWTLTITGIDRVTKRIDFELHGNVTGYDGKGTNKKDFISNSGRIKIEGQDFFIFESEEYTKKLTPAGFTIEWEIKTLFNDTIVVRPEQDVYLIAQGLQNKSHNLTLIMEQEVPVKSIMVYTPPLK